MNQYYEAQVYDAFVIKGNSAVFKCNIPSFVSDHVEIISWEDTQGTKFLSSSDYGKFALIENGLFNLHFELDYLASSSSILFSEFFLSSVFECMKYHFDYY